jgi:Uma2 family endonuclease
VTPAPSPKHQETVLNLALLLSGHLRSRAPGKVFVAPVDCILSDTTVVQPDIVYLDPGRLPAVTSRGIEGPPTLVVEVLSPSTAVIDRAVKRQLYARHGIPYYWIVDPDARRIEAYGLAEGAYQAAEAGLFPPFPGLRLDPAAIWPEP